MKKNDEFYVGYLENTGSNTKRTLKRFVIMSFGILLLAALIFSFTQKPFKNSAFELNKTSKITGTYHESPYPMLRVEIAENTFKNILLLGFGKSSANPFLEKLRSELKDLNNKTLSIEGNLIYYHGKTLLQITDSEKVKLENQQVTELPKANTYPRAIELQGEIIDPKCYFGVMKPGYGKIHRSCAVRCISGGIPPVLAVTDKNNHSRYYLLTDLEENPIHEAVLPFIGKPAKIKGILVEKEDWKLLKIDSKNIVVTGANSKIYE